MVGKYAFRSKWTRILKVLRSSLTRKRNLGWSRETGAGFLAEEIVDIIYYKRRHGMEVDERQTLRVELNWPHIMDQKVQDFNLRETEELLKFAKAKEKEEKVKELGEEEIY